MLRGSLHSRAAHGANGKWHVDLATEHVAKLGGLVEQGVKTSAEKVHEHQLCDWAQPSCSRAHRSADKAHLRNRGVAHPVHAKFSDETARSTQHPAHLLGSIFRAVASTGHVFAHQDDSGVSPHRDSDGLVDRSTRA